MIDPSRLLFIHGSDSNSHTFKATLLRGIFPSMLTPDFIGGLPERMEQLGTILGSETGWALIGSSLGGLTAARVAERDPRVVAVVLFAPAFQLAWRKLLGPEHAGFIADVEAIDRGYPDVRVPALVFHGRNDETVPIEHSRVFARDRPNVRLVELDDGHELVASLPVLLAETERFLAGLDH